MARKKSGGRSSGYVKQSGTGGGGGGGGGKGR
jgi:hypothetical protein